MRAVVWIALSEQGQPAPFIGYAFQRGLLRNVYKLHFGHTLESAGYQAVKAYLTTVAESPKGQRGRSAKG